MDYATLKLIHQTAAVLSICGFVARGVASLAGAAWVRGRVARTLPHVIDSGLLASALGLAWTLRLNPMAAPWLLAKIVGLLVYIALGVLALRAGLPRPVRAVAFAAAVVCFAQIVAMATTKKPAGLLVWF
jgi:uncharacterized membrane protein SirB2